MNGKVTKIFNELPRKPIRQYHYGQSCTNWHTLSWMYKFAHSRQGEVCANFCSYRGQYTGYVTEISMGVQDS